MQPRLPDPDPRVRQGLPEHQRLAATAKKLTTIGKATVTLKGGQKKKITIKLNSKGKKLLKKIKKFKATLTVTQTVNGAKAKQILKKNVKFKGRARARRASSTVAPRRSPGAFAVSANAIRVSVMPRGVLTLRSSP